ncbi:MAG: nicotinate-nucleotide adenylyltransferase [Lachnospiraceae bacterium]|nr:nicotinate-nucleotide adenylyltransferase [Lachnospiraceae bacterium]
MKIGILGGTFNPIHMGHLLIAENALTQFSLDRVNFMPAFVSPFKLNENVLSGDLRAEMINLSISDNERFFLDRREIDSNEVSYTYKTLTDMKQEFPNDELFFIVGGDSLRTFKHWRNPEIILEKAVILAAVRGTDNIESLNSYRDELMRLYNCDIRFLHTPMYDISSSDIRERIKNGQSVRYMLKDELIDYILKNNIYK